METKEYKRIVVRERNFLFLKILLLFFIEEKLKLYKFDELLDKSSMEYLINCLWDTYEDIRLYSLEIIIKLNVSFDFFDK
jgi:hypothetical protein